MRRWLAATVAAMASTCAWVAPAAAAKSCDAPSRAWQRATPAEAGMDAERLRAALDYASSQLTYAVGVYRHGCLVGEDQLAPLNRNAQYESWSMAKSVTSLVFGRAMTMGLISPDDPVGALFPEADAAHGAITMRELLTMTSGLRWNGFRDYNVFTMPDRIRDALTLEAVRPPGTYFEYAQSAVSLLAEAVGRAVGEDMERFAERELTGRLGIRDASWFWVRDKVGHVGGFYGVNMRPDDFGRLGELLRRDGEWDGRRLLSRHYLRQALAPTSTNGCYGWLIWVNAGSPCIGARIVERPLRDSRDLPGLPADVYQFAGLFDQLVAVFPSQGIVVVRTGQDPDLLATEARWEHEFYRLLLGAIADQEIEPPGEPEAFEPDRSNPDAGFQTSLFEPDQYATGVAQDPLPPAGPVRARAALIDPTTRRATSRGSVAIRLACPPRWPGAEPRGCAGEATLDGAGRSVRYAVEPGATAVLRFRLSAPTLRSLRRSGARTLELVATNADAAGGTRARQPIAVRAARSRRGR